MRITNTPSEKLRKIILDAVVKAYKIAGYNVPSQVDLAEIVVMTEENLRKYFRNNDTQDIATAFEKGALGDFGENKGISVARFHQWMRTYNGNATNQQPVDEELKKPEPPRDRIRDGHNMVNSAYMEWLRRGYNLIPASIILSWLVGDQKIPELRKKTEEAYEQANATLNAQYMQRRERYQKIADFIKQNQKTEADAIVLNMFFEECKAAGVEKIYE